MANEKKCLYCGEPLPPGKRNDAQYCSEKHRKYAGKTRKERKGKIRKAGNTLLSGIPIEVTQKPQPLAEPKQTEKLKSKVEQPQEEAPLTFSLMPPLRNFNEGADKLPPPPEPPPPFTEQRPVEIQPRYASFAVSVVNPKYKALIQAKYTQSNLLERQRQLVRDHLEHFKKIDQAQNMTTLEYLAYGAGGGVVGSSMAEEGNKDTGAFLGFLGGILTARIKDLITQPEFQRRKTAMIEQQKKNVHAAHSYYMQYENELYKMKQALAQESELISEPKTKLENEDEILQREIEIEDYERRKNEAHELSKRYTEQVAQYREAHKRLPPASNIPEDEIPKAEVDSPDIVSSVGFNKVTGGLLQFKGVWLYFIGNVSPDFQMLIHGPSGSGKSHLAVQFAYYFAVNHGTVLYNSSEEGFSVTMDKKLESLGARVKGLDIGKFQSFADFKNKVGRTAYNLIVLDSVNDMHMDKYELQEFCRYYSCSVVVGICQQNKAGQIRGGANLEFDSDVIVNVEDGIARIQKNRFLPEKHEVEIFKITPVVPEPVEQTRGKIITLVPDLPKTDESQDKPKSEDKPKSDDNANDGDNPDLPGDPGFDDFGHVL